MNIFYTFNKSTNVYEFLKLLKRVCHKIIYLYFFMIRAHLGPLKNRLKHFRIIFRFLRDILFLKNLRSVHHNADCAEICSAVCITPQSQTAHHGVKI